MRRTVARMTLAALLAFPIFLTGGPLFAGALPLFRHAFLHWPAGQFEVVVYHRGVLDEDDERMVNVLRDASKGTGANLEVFSVDLVGQVEERLQVLWEAQTNAVLPWVVVRPPGVRMESLPLWSGPLSMESIGLLLDSPARRKIADGLLRGDAAVWVLLESGDVTLDEAAVDVLARELKAAEKARGPASNAISPAVTFSLVRVTRNDPAEAFLAGTLLFGGRALRARPTAYPAFGRGRVLPGLTGRHLDDERIRSVCSLLTRAVTNTVAQSAAPSRELLLSVDWDAAITNQANRDMKSGVPALPVPSEASRANNTNVSREPRATVLLDETGQSKSRIFLAVFGGALFLLAAGCLLRRRRRR